MFNFYSLSKFFLLIIFFNNMDKVKSWINITSGASVIFSIQTDKCYLKQFFFVYLICILILGWSGQNWNFIRIIWFLHHLKALNERISEWAHFLNLAKRFWRYLNFSTPKNGGFFRQALEGSYISNGTKKKIFKEFVALFWE